ncbi:AIR synthase-related protein [Streptomyces sp. NPDC002851]
MFEDVLGELLGACPSFGSGVPVVLPGTYVVDPPFHGCGDIGHVAVCGTVNELAAAGAEPLGLTLSAVVEAGLPVQRVLQVAASVREAAAAAGVVVCGVDARVVRAGEADQIYLHTTGLGVLRRPGERSAGAADARAGDALLVSGALGGHGAHVLSARRSLGYEGVVSGGCAPLNGLLEQVREAVPREAVRAVRTVTRGGLAAALRAHGGAAGLAVRVDEAALPVRYEVRVALDALGIDPLDAAGTGCVCLCVAAEHRDAVLAALRAHPLGQDAAVVGELCAGPAGTVRLARADGGGTVPVRAEPGPPARLL